MELNTSGLFQHSFLHWWSKLSVGLVPGGTKAIAQTKGAGGMQQVQELATLKLVRFRIAGTCKEVVYFNYGGTIVVLCSTVSIAAGALFFSKINRCPKTLLVGCIKLPLNRNLFFIAIFPGIVAVLSPKNYLSCLAIRIFPIENCFSNSWNPVGYSQGVLQMIWNFVSVHYQITH